VLYFILTEKKTSSLTFLKVKHNEMNTPGLRECKVYNFTFSLEKKYE